MVGVIPCDSGTVLWGLDTLEWKDTFLLSKKNDIHADTKVDGDTTHILLFRGTNSELISIEYDEENKSYKMWQNHDAASSILLDSNTETATLDLDSKKRMWVAYDTSDDINVIWSDPPYSVWSLPKKIAADISNDDICAITTLPQNQIAVMWSNQRTKRFGFKIHNDIDDPFVWSDDEIPASQSAMDDIGLGMADDHINLCVSSNGDLFAVVKTSYDKKGYAKIALLVRRSNSKWDDLYYVDDNGTRPIVCLNEKMNKLQVIYSASENYNKILMKESLLDPISFDSGSILIDRELNNVTSTKQNYSTELVVLASNNESAIGVKIDYK